jgi:hypothetical protein
VAEYIKLRMTAAKAGVTLALMGLIAGIAERAQASPQRAGSASVGGFLKLKGLGSAIGGNFLKLEQKVIKLDTSLQKIDKVLPSYLKIKTADNTFLKIGDANAKFLKLDDANAKFLKITDANAKFLNATGTAVNSAELGGQTPDAFVQGHGGVVSGAVAIGQGSTSEQTLLQVNGTLGTIIVVCKPVPGAGIQVILRNQTQATLPAVQDQNGMDTSKPLPPGDTTLATINGGAPTQQLHLQTFPPAGSTEVITLMISAESGPGTVSIVGQALSGNG